MYQLEALGVNESELAQTQNTFNMIKTGDISGYQMVNILGCNATAIFWKQWIDSGSK